MLTITCTPQIPESLALPLPFPSMKTIESLFWHCNNRCFHMCLIFAGEEMRVPCRRCVRSKLPSRPFFVCEYRTGSFPKTSENSRGPVAAGFESD